jgi:methionine biosynthesis protein metW
MPKSAQFFPAPSEADTERGVDLRLFVCPYCGMMQLDGEPVPYYREVIRATRVSPEMRAFRVRQFREWIERYQLHGKRIIEIGCGGGEFLSMMKEAGADAEGIEFSEELVQQAHAEGLRVHRQFLEEGAEEISGAPYDAFYILSFLEHNPNPCAYLRRIAQNLTEDAVGIVEVPDVDMILREQLYSEFIQDHLLYFTEDTLRRTLEHCGFEVLACTSIWHGYVLSAEVRRRRAPNVSDFLTQQEKVRRSVDAFLLEMEAKGIHTAVWGAGHQALADLSLLGMAGRIDVVVDSADFKQNKLTPATHIPIVAPSVLTEGKIGAVLVIAGSYSSEIVRILGEKYPAVVCAVLEHDGVRRT